MKSSEYASYDGLGLAGLIAKGEVTPAETVEAAIDLTEKLNPAMNAVIHKHYERAREEAGGALPEGPFRGVPYLLKDLDGFSAGDPFHAGSEHLKAAGYVADTDGRTRTERFGATEIHVILNFFEELKERVGN